ncbi:hypothetical protein, partial [Klebsiella pneumoniae]
VSGLALTKWCCARHRDGGAPNTHLVLSFDDFWKQPLTRAVFLFCFFRTQAVFAYAVAWCA